MQRIPPFRTLDALRGFAAVWVVMVHSCDRFLGANNLALVHQPLYAFAIRGQLGVIFFFIISGYCITAAAHSALYSGKSLNRYALERGRRIFPPYWIALLLGVLIQVLLSFAESHHWIAKINHPGTLVWTPRYWVANLTLTQSELHSDYENIVFWSLCYEVTFYAIVGLWLWVSQRVARSRGMASGQLTLILGLAGTTYATLLVLIIFAIPVFPFDLWHQFALGGILFYVLEARDETVAGYSRRFRLMLNGVAGVAIVLSVAFAVLRQLGGSDIGHPSSSVRTLVALLLCLFLAGIRRFDARIAKSGWMRPLLWLGAASYSLYLVHPLVLPFIDVTCRRAGLDGGRYWIAFWIQVVVAVGFGRLFYQLIERHCISSQQVKRLREEHVG